MLDAASDDLEVGMTLLRRCSSSQRLSQSLPLLLLRMLLVLPHFEHFELPILTILWKPSSERSSFLYLLQFIEIFEIKN